ncbi:uncharacterized protein LOC129789524 [Lutzomyia longipalpis]|uniref:uncharacterized protein LOC129789524 n=1 Tax=Lutzomyia longipalpis TaxID=7200 RepID=UPI00248362B3|nr:uncharacterized protein LOC129789524 [Lutzomyia longipalpis]
MEELEESRTVIVSGYRENEATLQTLIMQSFRKDGFITQVILQDGYALVTFENAQRAREALQRPHFFNTFYGKTELVLKLMEDTNPEDLLKLSHSDKDEVELISKLNDDCLEYIFTFLNLRELSCVQMVCKRFDSVARIIYRARRILDFDTLAHDGTINFKDAKRIAQGAGPYVHTLIASKNSFFATDRRLLKVILKPCKKLENLHLMDFDVRAKKTSGELSRIMQPVKVARLVRCKLTEKVAEKILKNANSLEKLDLSKNGRLYGYFVKYLRGMKELNVSNCKMISRTDFINFCKMNPDLRSLNIIKCIGINQDCLRAIATNLRSLETLAIQYRALSPSDFIILADLPKLIRVEIRSWYNSDNDTFLRRLATLNRLEYLDTSIEYITQNLITMLASFHNLRVLKLRCDFLFEPFELNGQGFLTQILPKGKLEELHVINNIKITNNDVAAFIERCPTLRLVDLTKCSRISLDLIKLIIPNLSRRTGILELIVGQTMLAKEIAGREIEFPELNGKIKLDLTVKSMDKIDLYSGYESDDSFSQYDN